MTRMLIAFFAITLLVGSWAGSWRGAAAENGDVCKHDGWRQLLDADGEPFKNQGDCSRDVAHGKPPIAANAACAGGRWSTFFEDTGPGGVQAFASAAACNVFFASEPCPAPAVMATPTPGGVLPGAEVTFEWSAGCGNTKWDLWVGTSYDTGNLFNASDGAFLSITVPNLPVDGSPIYYRLTSSGSGVAWYEKGSFTAFSAQ